MSQTRNSSKPERNKRKAKKKPNPLRIVGGVFLALFALYLGYQLFGNMGRSIRTQEAFVTTVEETADATGIFVRDQILVTGKGGSSAKYLVENGERVSKGQQVALFFNTESAAQTFQTCQELEYQLKALQDTYANLTSGMDSLKLDSMIYTVLQQIATEMDNGNTSELSKLYASLNQLVISRGSSDGNNAVLKAQIAQVEADLKEAKSQLSGKSKAVTAPQAGYFLKSSDGFETQFTVASLATLTVSEVKNAAADSSAGGAVGSVVRDFVWYYAAVVDHDTAEALRNRTSIPVRFPKISDTRIHMSIESIRTEGNQALVILKSGDMNAKYLSARCEDIQFVLNTYTGIQVPKQALRQVDGQWGVYCLDGSVAKFKPVEWVYQTSDYYLVPAAGRPADGLYQYDKMIIGAKNLTDGQVMK